MLSDGLRNVVTLLELAAELDAPMAPENCRLLARVVGEVEAELRPTEEEAALDEAIAESPNVVAFPRAFRCATPPGAA